MIYMYMQYHDHSNPFHIVIVLQKKHLLTQNLMIIDFLSVVPRTMLAVPVLLPREESL